MAVQVRLPCVQEVAQRRSGISMAILEIWAAMLGIIRVVELYDERNGVRGLDMPLLIRVVPCWIHDGKVIVASRSVRISIWCVEDSLATDNEQVYFTFLSVGPRLDV